LWGFPVSTNPNPDTSNLLELPLVKRMGDPEPLAPFDAKAQRSEEDFAFCSWLMGHPLMTDT
jgi:hypothetical protein